jgi:release factor glutamine methyltransferase
VLEVNTQSLGALLDAATHRLTDANIPHARREATHIYSAVAGVSPGEVWLGRQDPADHAYLAPFEQALAQRIAGVPFAYAVGRVSFRTLTLRLDRRALIPRPETEGLVEHALALVAPGGVAADVGTGSGCLALALAEEGRFERVVAVDNSAAAVALARENVGLIQPRVPVDVVRGDLVEPLRGRRWRLIVSNPPYLSAGEYASLDPSVRDYEPFDALVSGPDGLDATRRLLSDARGLVEPDGVLALEIDERRADAVRALGVAAGWSIVIREDLFGKPRYAFAVPKEEA